MELFFGTPYRRFYYFFDLFQTMAWYTNTNPKFFLPYTDINSHEPNGTPHDDQKPTVSKRRKSTSAKRKQQPKQKKTKNNEKDETVTQDNFI